MTTEAARILVVDDEPGIREGARKVLLAEGYQVVVAEDGQAGLERYKAEGPFTAAVIDMKMPRMGGLELLEHLLRLDPDLIVVVVTAYATIETAVEATKRGAYHYIPKPLSPDELILALARGLQKRQLSLEARQLRQEREDRLLEVAHERSRSATIIGCMSDGVLVINRDGQIVLRNSAAGRVLGQLGDRGLPLLIEDLSSGELKDLARSVLASGGTPAITSREVACDGLTYLVNVSPVLEPGGAPLGAVVACRDITAFKKLEIAKSMFVTMVAHEVKAPLATIESILHLLRGPSAPTDEAARQELIGRCALRAETLRTLVTDLLSLSAIENAKFILHREPLQLEEVLERAGDMVRQKATDKGIDLRIDVTAAPLPKAMADANAMLSVLMNLIDNAIKYTPQGGSVHVTLGASGPWVTVAVKDTGIGLSAEQSRRVFEEFYRVKRQATQGIPGTGLGLSLVKKLVDLHQGTIGVESELDRGSTFTVKVPRAGQEG